MTPSPTPSPSTSTSTTTAISPDRIAAKELGLAQAASLCLSITRSSDSVKSGQPAVFAIHVWINDWTPAGKVTVSLFTVTAGQHAMFTTSGCHKRSSCTIPAPGRTPRPSHGQAHRHLDHGQGGRRGVGGQTLAAPGCLRIGTAHPPRAYAGCLTGADLWRDPAWSAAQPERNQPHADDSWQRDGLVPLDCAIGDTGLSAPATRPAPARTHRTGRGGSAAGHVDADRPDNRHHRPGDRHRSGHASQTAAAPTRQITLKLTKKGRGSDGRCWRDSPRRGRSAGWCASEAWADPVPDQREGLPLREGKPPIFGGQRFTKG